MHAPLILALGDLHRQRAIGANCGAAVYRATVACGAAGFTDDEIQQDTMEFASTVVKKLRQEWMDILASRQMQVQQPDPEGWQLATLPASTQTAWSRSWELEPTPVMDVMQVKSTGTCCLLCWFSDGVPFTGPHHFLVSLRPLQTRVGAAQCTARGRSGPGADRECRA